VLIVDHRVDDVILAMDRVVILDRDGRVLAEGPPRTVFREQHAALKARGIWIPLASELDAALLKSGIALEVAPLTMDEALSGLDAIAVSQDRARAVVTAFIEEPSRCAAGPWSGSRAA
jgi:hypothetical protein